MYIKAYSAELKRKMRLSYRSEEEGSTYAVGVGNIKAKAQLNPKLNIPSTIQTQWTLYPFDQFDRLGRQGSISVKYPTYEGCYIFMGNFFFIYRLVCTKKLINIKMKEKLPIMQYTIKSRVLTCVTNQKIIFFQKVTVHTDQNSPS